LDFLRCCGGLFATTSTARSKRAHALGFSSTASFERFGMTTGFQNQTGQMHAAIGKAIHSYSKVEVAQVRILEGMLKLETLPATILFFSVQNVRARNEMIDSLLGHYYGGKLENFWAECSRFLYKLALFRNAIAHWVPGMLLHMDHVQRRVTKVTPFIAEPKAAFVKDAIKLEADDLKPFNEDCEYIADILMMFGLYLRGVTPQKPSPSLDKYQQLAIRQNLADLQQLRTPKASQRQRPPSRASAPRKQQKPSAKQRRQRALSEAAKRKKS
jgi:hypothetical protein